MSSQESMPHTNHQGRRLLLGAGLAAVIILAIVLLFSFNQAENSEPQAAAPTTASQIGSEIQFPESGPPLQVGDMPYQFTLNDLDGSPVSLQAYAGRPLIINYWATWCGPCRIEMPHLQHTFENYQDDELLVLALDQDETVPEVREFFDEFALTFPALMDEGSQTSQNYGVGRTLPTSFFINAEGQITAIHRGPMTQGQIDGYLEGMLP